MNQVKVPELGTLPDESDHRDAIHIAVIPLIAGEWIAPGTKFVLRDGKAIGIGGAPGTPIGVVDPFLMHTVEPGGRFWGCLYPNTVMSLRHAWTHPAFSAKVPEQAEKTYSEKEVKELISEELKQVRSTLNDLLKQKEEREHENESPEDYWTRCGC